MAIHAKTDSDLTSIETSSPPRSPRRPSYYVMSPINPEADRTSMFDLSPNESPIHYHYLSHQRYISREFSASRFSASHKTGYWRRFPPEMRFYGGDGCEEGEELEEEEEEQERWGIRCYAAMFVIGFFLIFGLFSIILWSASKAHEPKITVQVLLLHFFSLTFYEQVYRDHPKLTIYKLTTPLPKFFNLDFNSIFV
ncbi:uncharacterized protein LOC110034594 [Phalaenopsis equestris]|uniref:uncharacterized protein LOC110034594 n=1 Tax=Phalaenopsis equestris TaxID=78828 RepID=UPI0009E42AEE|nr:uncharacterized protein LOC110034594 [Phalaenopsis equestris]